MEDQEMRSSSPPLPGKGYYNIDFDALDGNISIYQKEKETTQSSDEVTQSLSNPTNKTDQDNNNFNSNSESVPAKSADVHIVNNQLTGDVEKSPKKRKSGLPSKQKCGAVPVDEGGDVKDRPRKSGLKKPKTAKAQALMSMSYDDQAHREIHREQMRTSSPPLTSRGFYNIDSIAMEDSPEQPPLPEKDLSQPTTHKKHTEGDNCKSKTESASHKTDSTKSKRESTDDRNDSTSLTSKTESAPEKNDSACTNSKTESRAEKNDNIGAHPKAESAPEENDNTSPKSKTESTPEENATTNTECKVDSTKEKNDSISTESKTESATVNNDSGLHDNNTNSHPVSEAQAVPKKKKSKSSSSSSSSSRQSAIPQHSCQEHHGGDVTTEDGAEKTVRHRKSGTKKARSVRPMSMSYDEQCMPEQRHLFEDTQATQSEEKRRKKSTSSISAPQEELSTKERSHRAEKGSSPQEKDLLLMTQKNAQPSSSTATAEKLDSPDSSSVPQPGKDLATQKKASSVKNTPPQQRESVKNKAQKKSKEQSSVSSTNPTLKNQPSEVAGLSSSAVSPKAFSSDQYPPKSNNQAEDQSTEHDDSNSTPRQEERDKSSSSSVVTAKQSVDSTGPPSGQTERERPPTPQNPQKKKHRARSSSLASEDGSEVRIRKEKGAGKEKKKHKTKKNSSKQGENGISVAETGEKGREKKSSRRYSTSSLGEGSLMESSVLLNQTVVASSQSGVPSGQQSVIPSIQSSAPPSSLGGKSSPQVVVPGQDKSSPDSGGDCGMTSSHSRDSIVKLVQVLKYSQSDWNKLKQELEIQFQAERRAGDMEWSTKLAEKQAQCAALEDQIKKLKGTNDDMRSVMGEFEKTIEQLQAEKEKTKNASEQALKDILSEKEQAMEDLRSVEMAFSDLHRRYEKTKAVLEGFKQNEETLKKCVQDLQNKVKKADQKSASIRTQAEERLDRASEEVEAVKRSHTSEIAKLEAALRKAHVQVDSLEAALDQKVKENKELTAICDELIAKVQ